MLLVQEAARSARSPGRAILVDLSPCARGAPTDLYVIHAEKKQLIDFAAITIRLIRTKSGDHIRNTHARILRPYGKNTVIEEVQVELTTVVLEFRRNPGLEFPKNEMFEADFQKV